MDPFWVALIGTIAGAIAGGLVAYIMDKRKYKQIQTNLYRESLVREAINLSSGMELGDERTYGFAYIKSTKYQTRIDTLEKEIIELTSRLEDARPQSQEDEPYHAKLIEDAVQKLGKARQRISENREKNGLLDYRDYGQ